MGTLPYMKTSINVWRMMAVLLLFSANISLTMFSIWQYDGGVLRLLPRNSSVYQRTLTPTNSVIHAQEEVLCWQKEGESVRVNFCGDDSNESLWHSPEDWQVMEAFISDLNMDGKEELSLLIWRPFRPWPVDRFLPSGGRIAGFHDRNDMSCHLILIGLKNGKVRELWAGSALVDPIRNLRAVDLDGDGFQEMVALEYQYNSDPGQASITVWSWNGFGFSLDTRQEGNFNSLFVLESEGNKVIVAQH